MPPKKVAEPERKPLIGRVGTNLRVGIVGIPNVGKSTFFNVITKSAVAAENFPFCTIDPNENKYLFYYTSKLILTNFKSSLVIADIYLHANMTDVYVTKSQDLKDYKSDTSVIIDRRYLKFLNRGRHVEDQEEVPVASEWYPRCNSYYGHSEDVDALNRVHHLLSAKKYLASFTKFDVGAPQTDPYDEDEAQIEFLRSKPACFLILGKPGIGERKLAQLLAEFWKCVYIDPEILVQEEIQSGSRAGQCIEFNLRCGRAIAVDVILHLLTKRIRSKSAQHRGFVICGFPLIRNDMYQDDPVSSESAVFTAHEIFEEIIEPLTSPQIIRHVSQISELSGLGIEQSGEGFELNQLVEEAKHVEPAEIPDLDIGSATSNTFRATNMGSDYSEQLMFIFSLCHDPLVILYIACQNTDVFIKHENYRYNLNTDETVDLLKAQNQSTVYTIFTKTPGFESEELPENFLEDLGESSDGLGSSEMNYLLYLPSDFTGNIAAQLKRYRYEVLPTIEKRVLLHDPQYFIKLDGRASPHKMFSVAKAKLRVLPLPRVVLPEKILDESTAMLGEDVDDADAIYDGRTPEDCFESFRERKIVNRMFKHKWSKWGVFCPVAMKNGVYAEGNPLHAVKFMNRLFFLSSEEAVSLFQRNPRVYLLPTAPRRSCKIVIIGPKASGKTAVSHCLAIYLSGVVLNPVRLQQEYFESKKKEYLEKVRNEAINVALTLLEDARTQEYEKLEADRKLKYERLLEDQLDLLKQRTALDDVMLQESIQLSAFPLRSLQKQRISSETMLKYKQEYESLRNRFLQHGLPFFSDVDLCASLVENPEDLNNYIPEDLKNPTPHLPPVDIFDNFVTEYADAAIAKVTYENIEMSVEDMLEMYAAAVKEVEEKNAEAGDYHGGWVIDGMPPNPQLLNAFIEKCEPDDIFVLRELERGFLLDRYKLKGQNDYKDYRKLFEQLGKPEVALRASSSISTMSYKVRLARDIIDDVLVDDDDDEFVDVDYFAFHSTRLALKEYDKELEEFESRCQELLEDFEDIFVQFDVTNKTLPQLMAAVVKHVDAKFSLPARELTPEERLQEVEDFGEAPVHGEDVEEEEQGRKIIDTDDSFNDNRRLGNTSYYCPVTFHDHWILWKGKEEFAAKYDDKLYFMRNEDALVKFIKSPVDYLSNKPPKSFPPPRICIIGVAGSGKTTLAKFLSDKLGLYSASYDDLLRNVFPDESRFEEESEAILLEDYLISNSPLPYALMDQIHLGKLWFEEPMKSCGFILDDFPKRPCDLDYMQEKLLIPDVILELTGDSVEVNKRRVQLLLNEWKEVTRKKQEVQDEGNMKLANEWEEEHNLRVSELLEMKRQERFRAKTSEKDDETEDSPLTSRSQISYDSVAEATELEEVLKQVDMELPQPVFEDNWETIEEATARIINQTELTYNNDSKFLRLLKERCEAQLIYWIPINADSSFDKINAAALMNVKQVKFRNESLFERCYNVSLELAEKLLEAGCCFLSRFGRVCPVQIYDNENPLHMFYPLEQKFELYPVLHRSYVYFLAGKRNRDEFRANPLKYTAQSNFRFPLIPFKVAVIGPPKCGKTTLAERFKKEMGLKHVTVGQAARYVLRFLPHSFLAMRMEAALRKGWELTSEMAMSCVAALACDAKSVTQGVVFDGFPNTMADVRHLEEIGLVPHLVIDLEATSEDLGACLAGDAGRRGLPVFSKKFIDHRHQEWSLQAKQFRTWLDREYQILGGLPIKKCKWGVWKDAYDLASSVLFEVKHYYKNCDKYRVLRLANLQVTPREFLQRQSSFRHFCPCCLHHDNRLVSSGFPPDRTGVVQFLNHFYWLCGDHIDEFVGNPEAYLSPYNKNTLPEDLPIQRSYAEAPRKCHENGLCIVCYVDGQPERVLRFGRFSLACAYKNRVYLFDTPECLGQFQSNPSKYYMRVINFKPATELAPLKLEELPVLGMLEQCVAENIVKAVTNTCMMRPIVPGLSIAQSAAMSVGLHLKVNNLNTPKESLHLFQEASRLFKDRRLSLIDGLARMKRNVNPYLHYEEPLSPFAVVNERHKNDCN